jgi:hypothetical protein
MEQVQVLSAVCKKLNNDIELLANQIAQRESVLIQLDANQHNQEEQVRHLNMDVQVKLSKTDAVMQKLQSDIEQLSHGVREAINGQQELNRSNVQRHQELKAEVIFIFI